MGNFKWIDYNILSHKCHNMYFYWKTMDSLFKDRCIVECNSEFKTPVVFKRHFTSSLSIYYQLLLIKLTRFRQKKNFKPHFVSKMCFLCTHNCLYLIQVPLWARNDMPPFSKTNPAHGDKNSNMSGLYNWFRLSLEFIQTGFKPFLSNNIRNTYYVMHLAIYEYMRSFESTLIFLNMYY